MARRRHAGREGDTRMLMERAPLQSNLNVEGVPRIPGGPVAAGTGAMGSVLGTGAVGKGKRAGTGAMGKGKGLKTGKGLSTGFPGQGKAIGQIGKAPPGQTKAAAVRAAKPNPPSPPGQSKTPVLKMSHLQLLGNRGNAIRPGTRKPGSGKGAGKRGK